MTFNLADLFELVVDAVPERTAMVTDTGRWSYADLDRRANQLANHLAAAGVGPNQHVGLMAYNGTEYVEGMLAAFKLARRPDQRQLPLCDRRAPPPVRRRRPGRAHLRTASSADGSPRWSPTCPA